MLSTYGVYEIQPSQLSPYALGLDYPYTFITILYIGKFPHMYKLYTHGRIRKLDIDVNMNAFFFKGFVVGSFASIS
jgi:hypothetical protein